MRDRLFSWSAVVVVAALVAGCSSGGDSATPPDASASTSPPVATSTSGEPVDEPSTPPVDPTAALEAEITAFFEEYIATVNASWTSADALARSREMFSESCKSCLAVYDLAERAHSENVRYEGEMGQLDDVQLGSFADEVAVFTATTSSSAAALVNSEGVAVQEFAATQNIQVIYQAVREPDLGWTIIKDEVLS